MTRFKRELMRRGYMLEETMDTLPWDGVEAIIVNSEEATYSIIHVSAGCTKIHFDRAMLEARCEYD